MSLDIIGKLIKRWFHRKSAESASDLQLESLVFTTENPVEFISALRECRKRFGAIDEGVKRLPDRKWRSRLYNVSHGWN